MHVLRWIAFALALLEGGWMAFDGTRALVTGDYVTPKTGPHAGELGTWARVVTAAGIDPRSTGMKCALAALGCAWLIVAVSFALGQRWAFWGMCLLAVGSLWYLVPGTVLGAAILVALAVWGAGGG